MHEPTQKEKAIIADAVTKPPKPSFWQTLGAYFVFAWETLMGRKGGG